MWRWSIALSPWKTNTSLEDWCSVRCKFPFQNGPFLGDMLISLQSFDLFISGSTSCTGIEGALEAGCVTKQLFTRGLVADFRGSSVLWGDIAKGIYIQIWRDKPQVFFLFFRGFVEWLFRKIVKCSMNHESYHTCLDPLKEMTKHLAGRADGVLCQA